jgi:hypothetical protein
MERLDTSGNMHIKYPQTLQNINMFKNKKSQLSNVLLVQEAEEKYLETTVY